MPVAAITCDRIDEAGGSPLHPHRTRVDALATVNPAELTRIAMDAIAPFFDATLAERTEAAEREAYRLAAAALAAHPQYTDARERIAAALGALQAASGDLEAAQEAAVEAFEEIELPDIEAPEPRLTADAPTPLYDSNEDFVTATERLKAHRALYAEDDD